MIQKGNTMILKVNRPSFQTKSNFVESVLNMRQDMGQFMNTNPDDMQMELKVRQFIDSNLRDSEAKDIYKKVPGWVTAELGLMQGSKTSSTDTEERHARKIAWLTAYREANEKLDKYYRIKGNEIKIGVVGKRGFNPEGIEIEFVDADMAVEESQEISKESGEEPVKA